MKFSTNTSESLASSLINATPRGFYRHFAEHAAQSGYHVLTYDYRGIGDSRPESLRGFPATMGDWALQDMAGIVDWVTATHAHAEVLMLGHSLGGVLPGLLDNADHIRGMVTVSAPNSYWRVQSPRFQPIFLTCSGLFPIITPVVGYLPWSRVSHAQDMPAGAALQMARWMRQPGGILDDPTLPVDRFARFPAPILAYSIDDDQEACTRAVDSMMSAYPNLERRHLTPSDAGVSSIGHFGLFRPAASAAWPEIINWLDHH